MMRVLTRNVWPIGLERNKYISRADLVLLSDLVDDGVRQEGRIARSKRGVRSKGNALRPAIFN